MNRDKAIEWLFSDNTGISSLTMCAGLFGIDYPRPDKPHDSADLARCIYFCQYAEVTDQDLQQLCRVYAWWGSLYKIWDTLLSLFRHHKHSEIYEMLKTIEVPRRTQGNTIEIVITKNSPYEK